MRVSNLFSRCCLFLWMMTALIQPREAHSEEDQEIVVETLEPPAPPDPQQDQEFVIETIEPPAASAPAGEPMLIEMVETPAGDNEFLDMDLSDLLSVNIESVSKRKEKSLESPLSVSVLTREDIRRSGARTIMEALRLAPGLIVREQTAGNYDIHIRGLDNVPPNTQLQDFSSSTILVMIDYRIVYNYFQGGTMWETLPVDLHDVDRIEIIRGPAAALYGPNAVTGVIHIITKRPKKKGFYSSSRLQFRPSWDERIAGVSAGYDFGKVSFLVSGNYHHAERHQKGYYSYRDEKWMDDPRDISRSVAGSPLDYPFERYPRLDLATDRMAANAFLTFTPKERLRLDLSGGYQNSWSQKIYAETYSTPLTTNTSESAYVDARLLAAGLTLHGSYQSGVQAIPLGNIKITTDANIRTYTYEVFDAEAEYDLRFLDDKLSIRPGLGFRRAEYEGLLIASHSWDGGTVLPGALEVSDPSKALQNLSGSLRGDIKLLDRLRFVAGVRLDYYFDRTEDTYYPRTEENMNMINTPTTQSRKGQSVYPSFQLGSTLLVAENQLLRVGYGRAHRSPFLVYTYFNDDYMPPTVILGNRAIDPMHSDAVELGYRGQIIDGLETDIEVFYSFNRDFAEGYAHAQSVSSGTYEVFVQYDNIDTVAHQAGLTASVLVTKDKLQGRVFATVQKTSIDHHAPNTLHLFELDYDPRDPANQVRLQHKGTPDFVGGLYLNLQPIPKLNLNANIYYFTGHTLVRADNVFGMMSAAEYTPSQFVVQSKAIVNAKISYSFLPSLRGFISGHNLLFQSSREYFYSDRTSTVAMLGLEYEH